MQNTLALSTHNGERLHALGKPYWSTLEELLEPTTVTQAPGTNRSSSTAATDAALVYAWGQSMKCGLILQPMTFPVLRAMVERNTVFPRSFVQASGHKSTKAIHHDFGPASPKTFVWVDKDAVPASVFSMCYLYRQNHL